MRWEPHRRAEVHDLNRRAPIVGAQARATGAVAIVSCLVRVGLPAR